MLASTQKNNYSLPIRSLVVLLPLLVIIIHLLITHEEKKPLLYILSNWGYYRALLFSTVMALAIITWVRQQSILLDKKFPWATRFTKRLNLQILRGLVLPAIFVLLSASIYFAFLGINILDTVYLSRYLFLTLLLLLVLNLIGVVWQLLMKRRPYIHASKLMHQTMLVQQTEEVDIACIIIENRQCFYYNLIGQRFFWTKTFREAIEALEGEQFFLIRRGILVNRKAITHVNPDGASLQLTLQFKLDTPLVVSNRNVVNFKHWFAQKT